jgi:hypothetical protein
MGKRAFTLQPAAYRRGQRGNPPLTPTVCVMPRAERRYIDMLARYHGISRSEVLRQIIKTVREQGLFK